MWWVGAEALDIYVGTRVVAAWRDRVLAAHHTIDGVPGGLALVQRLLATQPERKHLRIWLSGSLCRPFIAKPPVGMRSASERRLAIQAHAQLALRTDEAPRVWIDGWWWGRRPRLAVAASESVIGQLERMAGQSPHRLRSIGPWWASTMGSGQAGKAQIPGPHAAWDCDSLTILAGRGQGYDFVSTVAPLVGEASARSALARALMAADLETHAASWAGLFGAAGPGRVSPWLSIPKDRMVAGTSA